MLYSILRTIFAWKRRAATAPLLKLDDHRLADLGLTRRDIDLAMTSDNAAAILHAARDRNDVKTIDPCARFR
jgi:hypothetical protein